MLFSSTLCRGWMKKMKFRAVGYSSTLQVHSEKSCIKLNPTAISVLEFEKLKLRPYLLSSLLITMTTYFASGLAIAETKEMESVETPVEESVDNGFVFKRPSDDRAYRSITLENGLRALLISDPNTRRSATALDVHIGSLSDPKEIPGLAHFCEHVRKIQYI